jgi:uncharacterized SAM-binding protein YcdF (DUF218 family)
MIPIWLCLFLASFSLSFESIYNKVFAYTWLRLLFILGLLIFFFIELLIFYSGHKTGLNSESDYIIVLGASVKGETMSRSLAYRVDRAYDYLEQHPHSIAVLSGGQGPGEAITEAKAMQTYLIKRGILENRLILEEASSNTYENIKFSYALINPDKKVLIVSSHFHILRSILIAHQQGFHPKGLGAKTFTLLAPNYYLREFFALINQLILG